MIGVWAEGAAIAGGVALATGTLWRWRSIRRRARLVDLARSVTLHHARLLGVKRKQLVIHDGYGNYELKPWIAHVAYFIDNVILREARARGLDADAVHRDPRLRATLIRTLLATLHAQDEAIAGAIADADIMSGEHYETLCRNLLQDAGWRVETTPVTGDQGADLIAEASGCRVIVQCKFYTKPVGNKAVQEAHAALGFHAGDWAAVVSNASFTRAARDLARANDVLLLHHDQLGELDLLIRRAEAQA